MAMNYRVLTEEKYDNKIEEILKDMPEYINSYMNHIGNSTTSQTRLGYLKDISNFLEYVLEADIENNFGKAKEITASYLESISLDFFNEYLKYLKHYEKNGELRYNSRTSIRRKLSSLRGLFNFLFLNEIINTNTIQKVQLPKVVKKDIVRMDKGETLEFISTVEHGDGSLSEKERQYFDKYATRDCAIINLLLGTGMRVSELVGLDILDIDLKHSAVKVIRKGGKEDIIFFNDTVNENLSNYLLSREKITACEGSENALFLSSQRKRISVRSVENLVKKYSARTKCLKNITPHKLRSTYGTALYEATGDLYLVAEVLGHNSVETTKKHYTEVTTKRKFENRNMVDFSGDN